MILVWAEAVGPQASVAGSQWVENLLCTLLTLLRRLALCMQTCFNHIIRKMQKLGGVELRLHNENQCPRCLGSVHKGVCKPNLVECLGPRLRLWTCVCARTKLFKKNMPFRLLPHSFI